MNRSHRLGLAALLCLQACAPGLHGRIGVSASLARSDASVTFAMDKGETLVIEVTSSSGIGSADLTISGPIPKRIVLRLLLRGMEKLEVQYGETIVTASLSSMPGFGVTEAIRLPSGEDREISPDNPYWMAVNVVPAEGSAAAIPLQHGYIEAQLPDDLLSGHERSFTIRWVDFFR